MSDDDLELDYEHWETITQWHLDQVAELLRRLQDETPAAADRTLEQELEEHLRWLEAETRHLLAGDDR